MRHRGCAIAVPASQRANALTIGPPICDLDHDLIPIARLRILKWLSVFLFVFVCLKISVS